MGDYNREPITIVEIDPDFCGNTYGIAPCTAIISESSTGQKCFNTYVTCQDRENYDRQTQTLRFVAPHSNSMIAGVNLLPLISTNREGKVSVSASPTKVNIGGASANSSPLGKRETVTIKMRDMPYNDAIVDPYRDERPYNPVDKGTFWPKWLARNPYYQGRNIRVLEGFAGQPLGSFRARHYIIDSITQPDSSGSVTIKAFDILRKTDGDKAKYPEVIRCSLSSDVDASQTTIQAAGAASDFNVSDPIISYGFIRINDEVIAFGSVSDIGGGLIQFNGCTRATNGTEASDHSAEDDIFRCVRVAGKSWKVAAWLLEGPAKIPSQYIDNAAWDAECEPWINTFDVSTLLTEAADVNKLVSELTQQSLFYIWWDAYEQEIKIKPFQLPGDNVTKINDTESILAGTYKESVDDKSRKTQVWVFFGRRDATESLDKDSNYTNLQVNADEDAESDNQYGEPRIMKIYSRWINNSTQALTLGFRLLARYRTPPRIVTIELDNKDGLLGVGDVLDVSHRNLTDVFGDQIERRFEVISKEDSVMGHKLKVDAQLYDYAGDVSLRYIRYSPSDYTPDYSSATQEEKDTGYYYADSNGKMPNGDDGYRYF